MHGPLRRRTGTGSVLRTAVAERAIPEMFGRGEAAKADRRRGCLRIELGDPEQGRAVAMRNMVEAVNLVLGVYSAADVGFEGLSGNRMLDQSISGFDPKRTSIDGLINAQG